MKTIRVYFTDFWPGLDEDNFLLRFLRQYYDVVIDPYPDYLFFSVYGSRHLQFSDCVKICFTGENVVPDFNVSDYALGFHHIDFDDRYMRLPLYVIYPSFERVKHKVISNPETLVNRKFCNFIYSNSVNADPIRDLFFSELSKYKLVDSGGKHLNNIGHPVHDKISFIKSYKFTIAFENSSVEGYTTEKIMEPMSVNSIPIYWGNPLVNLDFNEDSFVNTMKYSSPQIAIDEIIELDMNHDLYIRKLCNPWMHDADGSRDWNVKLVHFFNRIFSIEKAKAKRVPQYGFAKPYLEARKLEANLLDERKRINAMKAKLRNLFTGKS